jgi:hypothetical protein
MKIGVEGGRGMEVQGETQYTCCNGEGESGKFVALKVHRYLDEN